MADGAVGIRRALLACFLLALAPRPRPALSASTDAARSDPCPWPVLGVDDELDVVELCANELPTMVPDDSVPLPSPNGYEQPLPGGHWYKAHQRPLPWHAAKEACEQERAHLLVPDSAQEAGVVRELLGLRPYHNSTIVHAGFYVPLVTIRGDALPWTWQERWVRGDPNAEACGQMDSDGFLLLAACVDERPFVCEYGSSKLSPAPPPSTSSAPSAGNASAGALPEGYEAAPGWKNSYYRTSGDSETVRSSSGAEQICENENADLASFESEEEIQAVTDWLQQIKIEEYYKRYIVGVRTGFLTTVLGRLLQFSEYRRWKERKIKRHEYIRSKSFWIDYQLFLHTLNDKRPFIEEKFLCEITSETFPAYYDGNN